MLLTRRSLLKGLLVTAVATIPAAKILRATEMPQVQPEHLFTSSWYEQLEKGLWRHQSYAFRALQAPEVLIVNASPEAREIAGVQFDWDDRVRYRPIDRVMPEGWVRGDVDVVNTKNDPIGLTRDEEQQLIERTRRPTTIIRPQPSDLFGFFEGEGSFV